MDIAIAAQRLRYLLDGAVRRWLLGTPGSLSTPPGWLCSAAGAWTAGGASGRRAATPSPLRSRPSAALAADADFGQAAALAVAVAWALVAPLVWLATREPVTPDALVVARSGVLLLQHGSPYLQSAQLARGGWLAYNPYLPVMAVFGLPKALGLPGVLADPRPWLAAGTFLFLLAAFRISRISRIGETPVTAFGLAACALSPGDGVPARLGDRRSARDRADLPGAGAAD